MPQRRVSGSDFVFVDNKARPHPTRSINYDVTRMQWPPLLPDCNSIEHILDCLQTQIYS